MGSLGVILWAVADATRMRGGSLGLCALRHAWLTLRSRKLSLGSRRVRKGLGADPWWQECRWEQGYSLAGKVQNQVITRQRATESAGCGWRALQALFNIGSDDQQLISELGKECWRCRWLKVAISKWHDAPRNVPQRLVNSD